MRQIHAVGPSSAELLGQVKERVDNDVVRWIGHWIGWTAGAPLSGTPYEGPVVAHGARGHEVEVVAGDHENLAGLQGEPCGSGAVKASSPDSATMVSSIWRCTSSILNVGCSALSMACMERRRYSLIIFPQSACMPWRAPAAAKARLRPWCQSRMVPPVSKVSALMCIVMRGSLRAHLHLVVRPPLFELRCYLLGE